MAQPGSHPSLMGAGSDKCRCPKRDSSGSNPVTPCNAIHFVTGCSYEVAGVGGAGPDGGGDQHAQPEGVLAVLALLPQFTEPDTGWPLGLQIVALGLVHVVNCAVVYTGVGAGARVVLTCQGRFERHRTGAGTARSAALVSGGNVGIVRTTSVSNDRLEELSAEEPWVEVVGTGSTISSPARLARNPSTFR